MKPETLATDLVFPEGPRWREGQLWFSDMHAYTVKTVDLAGGVEERLHVPGQPSGLGWTPDDELLVVSMTDRRLLSWDGDDTREVADLSGIATWHCNDMVVDAEGRAYVGNFGFDLDSGARPCKAALAVVHPDGRSEVAAADLSFPNGSVLTPDGRTLVVGESFGARLTAFDVGANGALSNRREWARLEGAVPDGICLDEEGAIWVASPVSNQFLRVREGGRVTHRIDVDQMAIACMLGGPARRHLFLLSAPDTHPDKTRAARGARIDLVEVEVPGAGLP
ncbi:MAG: SMP-30/gluconolactonase/LRE family protein [Myxococcota bacterium]